MTLLEWLLPTLVILGGLLDALFVLKLWKEKQPKEQVDEKKPEEKTSKMQKFLQFLRCLFISIKKIGTVVGATLLFMVTIIYYYEATSLLNQDTLARFNATSKLLKKDIKQKGVT